MLGFFAYLGACLIGAFALTIVYGLLRPISDRGELRSWRYTLLFFLICVIGPYGWAEMMTKMHGAGMEPAVHQVMDELKIQGELRFYRVLWFREGRARVVAVGEDRESWGGRERALFALTLQKKGDGWEALSYDVVNSTKRTADGFTMPPYW
jgi:hypothetical protein